jgi:hypothetical protein
MSRFKVGDAVTYRPHTDAPAEHGIVSALSSNVAFVFVRYSADSPHGKFTCVSDLTLTDDS